MKMRAKLRVGLNVAAVPIALLVTAACGGPTDRADRAASAAAAKLSNETFAQAAEPGRCADGCGEQERGFAFAKTHALRQPDNCNGKGDEDFVEGCRQYGEDIEEAYKTAYENSN
jgi:hypothetical protein